MSSDVLIEVTDAVMTLTIDRELAANALTSGVLEELRDGVQSAEADPAVRVVIVTGAGSRAFCAGADLAEMSRWDDAQARTAMRNGQQSLLEIERSPVPVIAAVNGIALGGGFELMLACTLSVLSSRATLGLPESGLGLMPGYGGTQRLPRRIGAPAAAHAMLTGERINADRAYQLGLTPVAPVPPEDVMTAATTIARTIAAQGPRAVRSILRAVEIAQHDELERGLKLETELAVEAITGAESTEGVAAFFERRAARFPAATGAEA